MKKIIKTEKAPAAIGAYSQAVVVGNLIFTAGQIAINPQTNQMLSGDISRQTKQVIENLEAIIEAAGSKLSKVIKTTVYLTTPEHFTPMNEVYKQYFQQEPPARVAVFVNALPKNALVEIDAIAQL